MYHITNPELYINLSEHQFRGVKKWIKEVSNDLVTSFEEGQYIEEWFQSGYRFASIHLYDDTNEWVIFCYDGDSNRLCQYYYRGSK